MDTANTKSMTDFKNFSLRKNTPYELQYQVDSKSEPNGTEIKRTQNLTKNEL